MTDVIKFQCPQCGLDDAQNTQCGITGEEIYIFGDGTDDDDGIIIDGHIWRVDVFCPEVEGAGTFPADVEPNHSWDYLQSACRAYATQIGLDPEKIDSAILLIRGKFQDSIAYDGNYIGHWFHDCVANLDKAKANQPYGTPLEHWHKK